MVKATKTTAFKQVAALCWRRTGTGEIEIVLVTTRESGRWILPKGWPIKGLSDAEAAETEAMEEAGVVGRADRRPIASYLYDKRLARRASVTVWVFPVRVERQLDDWLEKDQRALGWFSPEQAAAKADHPEIARIILEFSAGLVRRSGRAAADAH